MLPDSVIKEAFRRLHGFELACQQYARAVKAYYRRFENSGRDVDAPSDYLSEQDDNFIYLKNRHGLLATYKILKSGKLQFVDPK